MALLARNRERLAKLAATLPGSQAFAGDVTDAESIRAVFEAVARELGRVEVLIYNAGKGDVHPQAWTEITGARIAA